jgi:hypothetical protein
LSRPDDRHQTTDSLIVIVLALALLVYAVAMRGEMVQVQIPGTNQQPPHELGKASR